MQLNDNGSGWFSPIIPGVFDLLSVLFAVRSDGGDGFFSLQPEGQDQFTFDDAHIRGFAHQIDVRHAGYPGGHFRRGNYLDSLDVDTYLSAKKENARLLVEKGLESKVRTNEIIGTAHFDAGHLCSSVLLSQTLDLGGVFDALIYALALWVDQAFEPPADDSGSDRPEGEEHTVIQLPEVAYQPESASSFRRVSSESECLDSRPIWAALRWIPPTRSFSSRWIGEAIRWI